VLVQPEHCTSMQGLLGQTKLPWGPEHKLEERVHIEELGRMLAQRSRWERGRLGKTCRERGLHMRELHMWVQVQRLRRSCKAEERHMWEPWCKLGLSGGMCRRLELGRRIDGVEPKVHSLVHS